MNNSDKVEICVGYVSGNSLTELDRLVAEKGIKNITLTIGMYYIEGMPEKSYLIAKDLNDKWMLEDKGEIRIV